MTGGTSPVVGLADLRIVAVEQYGAGPFASLHLAEMGADVIKVEDARTSGDIGRHVPPFAAGDDSLFFQSFNRNKKSVSLDLSTQAGMDVLHRLLQHADALIYNLRGDVPDKIGLRYADLAPFNPRLVVCSLSGFGMTGACRAEPAYDYVLQGMAGWMALTGDPEGAPTKSGLSLVDYCGGLVAAFSLLAGVHAAHRDGVGGECDVSLFDTAMSMLSYPATWFLTAGHETSRQTRSSHPSIVPFGVYPTAEGWIVLACAKPKFFTLLMGVIDRSDAVSDPRFATLEARLRHRDELDAVLDDALSVAGTEYWVERLTAAGVPCGPINGLREALDEQQTRDRDLVVGTPHPVWGEVRHVRTAARGWWAMPAPQRAPALDEHREAVLREVVGITDAEMHEYGRLGAFGSNAGVESDGAVDALPARPDEGAAR
jgi:crotonobetainyl-CoA:carnitine CoA-transferase CaiB-like acyl-CoA transferase